MSNILLNLYRYSKETSEKLLALLEKSKDRLWLPHQIALEFHLNRTNVILDQQTSYEKIESLLRKKSSEIESSLKKELGSYRKKHVTLSIDSIIDQIKSSIDGLISEISQEKEDHPSLLKNDHVKHKITELFDNRVGAPYKKDKLNEIKKEADKRYVLEIPPGYRDASKKGAKFHNGEIILEKYGDYILWQQIIDFANEKQTNIIFITDEEKKDWWYESKGKTIGPRSELLNEFNYNTRMEFYMFKPEVFMKEAGDIYSESFSDNSISEVKEVRRHYFDFFESHSGIIIG
ncbi:PIN-like domain-containing protein [Bacillus inaquosorum]